jgi:hypothetical protein
MKIDDVSVQYTIPGHESEISELAETSDADELDYGHFTQTYQSEMPALGAWKQLLGLSQTPPDPTHFDPPPKPAYFDAAARTQAEEAHRFLINDQSSREAANTSPKIRQMFALFSAYQRAVDEIKARAAGNGNSQ